MNRYLKMGLGIVAAGAVGFAGGVWVGAFLGVEQFLLIESSTKSSILVGQLRELRAGKTNRIITMKEIRLDREIVKFSRFLEEGHPWILWPFNRYYDHDRYMRSVAAYRKEYPPITPTVKFGEVNREEMEEYAKDVSRITKELVERYSGAEKLSE